MSSNEHPSPFGPLQGELAKMMKSNLNGAIKDVDKIIELLENTKAQISQDTHRMSLAMTTLQNPVKQGLDAITDDLKNVTKAQKGFGKALDRAMPLRELPVEIDTMEAHTGYVNRAVVMHLIREGQFPTAETLFREADFGPNENQKYMRQQVADAEEDQDMDAEDENMTDRDEVDESLTEKFREMYSILDELKDNRNMEPAIEWCAAHSDLLESKGSSLEFDLTKLQFIWLFNGTMGKGLQDDLSRQTRAVAYAHQHFGKFQRRHQKEINQLCAAMVYGPNIASSPYGHIFTINTTYEQVAESFTKDFCSLLGLSAESPLYIAVTAGSLALPRLIKYTHYMREKKTEWTTEQELAFETPLPSSMIYHPIFVCPVSKEQTTDKNPPVRLACGHVLSKESLDQLTRSGKYKCPYCPAEGTTADTIRVHF
ncbi:CTLH/CRA C-terminal to lish motif domain-containing protein [Emericellopsis atlantica]|uniref:GID complex catalytic subunit 2 n=1 Tax=Emericellopsis atlantica TaxID=2614577 RepID=A0A9P7ZQD1_9HYPO|nr:CTLH/CRA C-terminal to lish motif domain-containing protein [Emericellopsis atlantica]KAG9255907.1 CTLH/CRA C-terminal to lish motif domain-containing protein [Emericellopsis atlantica]